LLLCHTLLQLAEENEKKKKKKKKRKRKKKKKPEMQTYQVTRTGLRLFLVQRKLHTNNAYALVHLVMSPWSKSFRYGDHITGKKDKQQKRTSPFPREAAETKQGTRFSRTTHIFNSISLTSGALPPFDWSQHNELQVISVPVTEPMIFYTVQPRTSKYLWLQRALPLEGR
jgi:hypothetical protein